MQVYLSVAFAQRFAIDIFFYIAAVLMYSTIEPGESPYQERVILPHQFKGRVKEMTLSLMRLQSLI